MSKFDEEMMKDMLELNNAYGMHFEDLGRLQREGSVLDEEDIGFIKYYATELLYRLLAKEDVTAIMKRLKDR